MVFTCKDAKYFGKQNRKFDPGKGFKNGNYVVTSIGACPVFL